MNNETQINSHESLKIGIILSLVGGILDAHTFLFRNGIFANTQTGNIVILALFLNTNKTQRTIQCIFSIFAFVLGIFITEFIKKKIKQNKIVKFACITLAIEILCLLVVSTIPKDTHNMAVIVSVSFVCSLQTNAFRSLKGSPYATTMCTGNLRSGCSSLFFFLFNKDRKQGEICFRYFLIILSFFFGAIIGKFLTNTLEEVTLLICSFLLFLAFLILVVKTINFKKNDIS